MGRGLQSRRDFLRTLGASAALLPVLHSMPARAQTAAGVYPRRMVFLFNGIGIIEPSYWPTGTASNFSFAPGSILDPLTPHLADISILRNLQRAYRGPSAAHQVAMIDMLTGDVPIPGGPGGFGGWANSPSVDQIIAKRLGNQGTQYASLQLAVQPDNNGKAGEPITRMSYVGYNQPADPMQDPYVAFTQLFADLSKSPAQLQQEWTSKKSVLDSVSQSLTRMRGMIASDDFSKLDAHLTGIRDIEVRLQPGGAVLAGCQAPTQGMAIDINANDNYPALIKLMSDILVATLACDMTRVASLQWSHAFCLLAFTWLNSTTQHHTLSHDDSDASVAQRVQIQTWYSQQVAYLLDSMKQVKEGASTLLDNTVLYWTNQICIGDTHDMFSTPLVLAGSYGGYFKTGQYLDYQGSYYAKNSLVSMCHAAGLTDIQTLGDSYGASVPGPLPGLTA